jgi:hypothetical protein
MPTTFAIRRPTEADFEVLDQIASAAYSLTKMPNPDGSRPSGFTDTPEGRAARKDSHTTFCSEVMAAAPDRALFDVLVEVSGEEGPSDGSGSGGGGGGGVELGVVGWAAWGRADGGGCWGDDEKNAGDPAYNHAVLDMLKRRREDARQRVFPAGEHVEMWGESARVSGEGGRGKNISSCGHAPSPHRHSPHLLYAHPY